MQKQTTSEMASFISAKNFQFPIFPPDKHNRNIESKYYVDI